VPSDHKSQSQHDWAYAKRVLARRDDPEVVIQRIADYRSEDKDDPNYYAMTRAAFVDPTNKTEGLGQR
jgi:hypothetical protein